MTGGASTPNYSTPTGQSTINSKYELNAEDVAKNASIMTAKNKSKSLIDRSTRDSSQTRTPLSPNRQKFTFDLKKGLRKKKESSFGKGIST
tara:strand:+ start:529 stop:801 length:273 start_codon:yes stop_codon:yes gene_type:complete